MKPDIPAVLEDVARKLRETILPDLKGFQANMVGMTAAMLDMTAEAWDGAADRLVQENAVLATLLAQGSELTGDPTFATLQKSNPKTSKYRRWSGSTTSAAAPSSSCKRGLKRTTTQRR